MYTYSNIHIYLYLYLYVWPNLHSAGIKGPAERKQKEQGAGRVAGVRKAGGQLAIQTASCSTLRTDSQKSSRFSLLFLNMASTNECILRRAQLYTSFTKMPWFNK